MIYSEIQNFLSQTTTPEVLDLFDRAAEVFEDANFEDWLDVLANVIGDFNDEGNDGVLDVMRQRLNEMLDSLLLMQGIVLIKEADLGERLSVMEALQRISNYEDKDQLVLELESNESAQEVLAGVVGLLSSMKVEAVLAVLEDVNEGLPGQIRALIEGPMIEQLEEVEIRVDRIAEYNKYKLVFSNDERWCDRFAQFPQAFGLPFDSYAKHYMASQLEADLVNGNDPELSWRKVCVNLIGMGCLSDQGSVKTPDNAKRYLEQICTDLGQVTQLHVKLNNLLMEFNRVKT